MELDLRIVRLLTESEIDRMDSSTPSVSQISLPKFCWSNSNLPNPVDRRPIPESVNRNSVYRIPIYRSQFTEDQFLNPLNETSWSNPVSRTHLPKLLEFKLLSISLKPITQGFQTHSMSIESHAYPYDCYHQR